VASRELSSLRRMQQFNCKELQRMVLLSCKSYICRFVILPGIQNLSILSLQCLLNVYHLESHLTNLQILIKSASSHFHLIES
jgi:hypothetical protein